MDKSTEGVTLFALFINDILVQYKEADPESYDELLEMADGHNLSDPFGKLYVAKRREAIFCPLGKRPFQIFARGE